MKNTESLLTDLLAESTRSFINQDINSISEFISDDFTFEFHFEKDDKKWINRGNKEEFLEVYRKLFSSGVRCISWDYKIISSSKTFFGKIKATLLFTCVGEREGEQPQETTNIENIVCVVKNGRLKLTKIESHAGKQNL